MGSISALHALGQSLWYDNIQRRQLETGELAEIIRNGDIRGVTSNPSIFHNAIARSTDYDTALVPMAWAGWTAEQIFDQLAMEDIRAAADLFAQVYQDSGGADGYVSLEVNPLLANSTEKTIAEARRLFAWAARPNVMIKIPATPEGIPAIRAAIADGINVNVTLIFSLSRYVEVMEAYLNGLEDRVKAGQPVDRIASVASFFVSRVDSKVDAQLDRLVKAEGSQADQARLLAGKAAIANARLAYQRFGEVFSSARFQALKDRGARVQRPLWASTSTKNPAYPDVMYIEELIGPDTVNTVPPQTLDAYRDHGQPRLTLEGGVIAAQQALDELAGLGISIDQVTAELEIEGVKAFTDAFQALIRTIEERRQAAVAELGPLAEGTSHRVAELDAAKTIERIHRGDASLWTTDPAGQEEAARRLGWLRLPETSLVHINEIEQFAGQVRAAGFTNALLLGMGGSSLAPEVLETLFRETDTLKPFPGLSIHILDSTDPDQVRAAAAISPVERTIYIVSSKSGGTSEVNAFLSYFWQIARDARGDLAGEHFIAITDPGTSLERTARERGFRSIFLADPGVGGRFSALTLFGLVPAGLAGLDIARLLAQAGRMANQCAADVPAGRNPGLVLGALMGEAAAAGRDKLTFLADPETASLGPWLEQLIAESSGKNGVGIVPIEGEMPGLPESYGADRLFVYLKGGGRLEDSAAALRQAGCPVVTIAMSDPYQVGAEFYRWEFATAVACAVLGVNAFDQPDVQDNKTRTASNIQRFESDGSLPGEDPIWESSAARFYGTPFPGMENAETPGEVVSAFIAQGHPGDFIALNAYLPRNEKTVVQLSKIRSALLQRSHLATTVGFGPRFLHSTGQLHKGGANNGLFLQITRDAQSDLAIPGGRLTFGVLERAQALGDLDALRARGRRALRVHLLDAEISDLLLD